MKILIRNYPEHAGKWIYQGYASAFEEIGYEVERWENLPKIEGSVVMMASGDFQVGPKGTGWGHADIGEDKLCQFLAKAEKIYMFVSPNTFPSPWGYHLNFVDAASKNKKLISKLRELDNIVFWTFCDPNTSEHWEEWGEVHHVPLAFDSLNYERLYDPKYEYDVCYVGGWADNGFNTKKGIMKEYLSAFKDSGLKCGFFINQNISHEQECKLLTNSKVCINIHDDYQQKLKLDTNERTWKSLGLNGLLVSDNVGSAVPDYVYTVSSPQEMVQKVQEIIADYPLAQKEVNVTNTLKKDTYLERAKLLESL